MSDKGQGKGCIQEDSETGDKVDCPNEAATRELIRERALRRCRRDFGVRRRVDGCRRRRHGEVVYGV